MANPTLDDDFETEWSVADLRSRGCRVGPGEGRPPVIHPDARIGNTGEWIGRATLDEPVEIGPNSVVRAYATIDAGVERPTRIGRDCLVMAHAYVAHDVQTGDRVQIGPSSVIGGCVTIGHDVKIGLNVTILPWRTIGDGARLGAGAVVTKNVPPGEVWAGNPARRLVKDTDA